MDWFLYDNGLRHERVKNLARLLKLNHSVKNKNKKNITKMHYLVLNFGKLNFDN